MSSFFCGNVTGSKDCLSPYQRKNTKTTTNNRTPSPSNADNTIDTICMPLNDPSVVGWGVLSKGKKKYSVTALAVA